MTPDLDALFNAAKAAFEQAYAPYSRFAVGAAIRAEDGAIYAGATVENAAYPAGTCAEAGAIAAMVTGGARQIVELVVVGAGEGLCTPCGACRQRIREFARPDCAIHVAGPAGIRQRFTLAGLLPASFGPENLPTGGGSR